MTEQEKREQQFKEKLEVLMKTHAELMDIEAVMTANGWTSAEPVNTARYSVVHLEKFFKNDTPDASSHGVNLDKARFIP